MNDSPVEHLFEHHPRRTYGLLRKLYHGPRLGVGRGLSYLSDRVREICAHIARALRRHLELTLDSDTV